MSERRYESRFLCADLVKVEWTVESDAGALPGAGGEILRTVEAVLEDISALGACVQVEEAIPPETAVSISFGAGNHAVRSGNVRLSGNVSYCAYRDYGYFVGIQFSKEMRWSSGIFEPQHLTNLEALMLTEPGIVDHAHTN
jgi:hypothetical protein